ncbi:potassium transporter Kup [Pelobacter seleniigenes]|uniref:potassium transporter Kup n=1 Tax=Pelobacter seleniigenes TaxID=407188 RepID=UPI0004A6F217|nr:potassium transporter Kup [Pelobacter seleniigenes]
MNMPTDTGSNNDQPSAHQRSSLAALSLTALGVVFGDIGTSPLYALKECFHTSHGLTPTPENVLGILSLILWALILVISIKYLSFILRADNQGEGGIMALTALILPQKARQQGNRWALVTLGLFGAALLYGDGMITPAISVLSAIEGLRIATPAISAYIIPITVVVLVALFLVQYRGTGKVGAVFGPLTLLWFIVLAILGIRQIIEYPAILAAVSPHYAFRFLLHNGWSAFLVLGSVFLVVTGGEALYADMGHFGVRPIRLVWFCLVLPALVLNYFGQGALLLSNPAVLENPFYHLAPSWALIPLVVLATIATIIASQAVISGSFSITMQAVQLGFCPRLKVTHTSARERGQIYVPAVNWILMFSCIGLVIGFGSSSHLAAAYGFSVTTDMVITTLLFFFVARERFHWPLGWVLLLCGGFLSFDLAFFGANFAKILHGGWFPLLVATLVFTFMSTWKTGRKILATRMRERLMSISDFLTVIRSSMPQRVNGTAVFMSGNLKIAPPALLHNLKHNRVLHQRVIILSVVTEDVPHVIGNDRYDVEDVGEGIYLLVLHSGFMDEADVPELLKAIEIGNAPFLMEETTFFLGHEAIIPSDKPGMVMWREHLFMHMSRNARSATSFFGLPPNRVVELGMQIEL